MTMNEQIFSFSVCPLSCNCAQGCARVGMFVLACFCYEEVSYFIVKFINL